MFETCLVFDVVLEFVHLDEVVTAVFPDALQDLHPNSTLELLVTVSNTTMF